MTTSEDEAFALAWPTDAEASETAAPSGTESLVVEDLWADDTPLTWAPPPVDPAPSTDPVEPADTAPVDPPRVDPTPLDPPPVEPAPRRPEPEPLRSPRHAEASAPTDRPRFTMRVRLAESSRRVPPT